MDGCPLNSQALDGINTELGTENLLEVPSGQLFLLNSRSMYAKRIKDTVSRERFDFEIWESAYFLYNNVMFGF